MAEGSEDNWSSFRIIRLFIISALVNMSCIGLLFSSNVALFGCFVMFPDYYMIMIFAAAALFVLMLIGSCFVNIGLYVSAIVNYGEVTSYHPVTVFGVIKNLHIKPLFVGIFCMVPCFIYIFAMGYIFHTKPFSHGVILPFIGMFLNLALQVYPLSYSARAFGMMAHNNV